MQERFLSPRTVHFIQSGVYWECLRKFVSNKPALDCVEPPRLRKHVLSGSHWNEMVEQYSQRNLTFEKDKLVAIAGIAETIQRQTNDEYYAGMWRENLEFQLFWKVTSGGRLSPPRAPSWSWAAVDAPCWFPYSTGEGGKTLKVLKVDAKRTTEYLFGDLPHAELWVSCSSPLVVGFLEGDKEPTITYTQGLRRDGSWGYAELDCLEHNFPGEKRFYLLRGFVRTFHEDFLLLKPTGTHQGEYERVGRTDIVFKNSENGPDLRENIPKEAIIFAGESAYIPTEEHEFPEERYVIKLV